MDTSGFYRLRGDKLAYAPNAVRAPTYDLYREERDSYTYPIHDWHWFDSEDAAKAFFEISGSGA